MDTYVFIRNTKYEQLEEGDLYTKLALKFSMHIEGIL